MVLEITKSKIDIEFRLSIRVKCHKVIKFKVTRSSIQLFLLIFKSNNFVCLSM
jgi:hypothetical protein